MPTEQEKQQLRDQRIERLKAARQAAKEANEAAIAQAMRALANRKEPITVITVAKEAKISRPTVYASRHLEEIKHLAGSTRKARTPGQASTGSLQRRLEDALEEIRKLKQERAAMQATIDSLLEASQA